MSIRLILIASIFLFHNAIAGNFTLSSSSIKHNKTISNKYIFNGMGCKGENKSPQITWKNVPNGTQSFAVTVYDPDAPTGSGWWHWTVFNISSQASSLPENASLDRTKLPQGAIEGRTDFGEKGYGGPCPPIGSAPHHYIITVYALKIPNIDLPSDASPAMLGFYINQNTIAKASITGLYSR